MLVEKHGDEGVMSRKMMAYRLVDWQKPPQMVEIDVPRPGAGEVLIKVGGNGLCHSDFIIMNMPQSSGQMRGWSMPFTLGHEISGWIEQLGEGVKRYSVGDPVLVASNSDGTCPYCLRGQDNVCLQSVSGRGYGKDGGLAHYVLVGDARQLIRLNTLDPVTAGPLADAGATSYHAVKRVLPKLIPGSTAVVIGVGGLGSFAVQYLRALSPTRVVAIDTDPARLDFAREMGAHMLLAGVDASTTDDLLRLTEGRGAEAVLDFVGIDTTIKAGLGCVRTAGAFALVGAGGGTLNEPWQDFLPREADIYSLPGGTIAEKTEVIALVEAGLIRNEVDIFPLTRVEEAYEKLDKGELRGRAVVTPNG